MSPEADMNGKHAERANIDFNKKGETIRILAMDADGTLTDGKIYLSEHGEMMKAFHAHDGYGIREILPRLNILPVVITGRRSAILELRCRELDIAHLYQDVRDKLEVLKALVVERSLTMEHVAYIGDDDNDLECMRFAALAGCPANASANILAAADFVSRKNGGDAAVRDFIEWLCERKDAE
jgi:3-deoxy-D-manno-octulosonate 8-phosphate phosphatase (KDO 8-P phosphatase)